MLDMPGLRVSLDLGQPSVSVWVLASLQVNAHDRVSGTHTLRTAHHNPTKRAAGQHRHCEAAMKSLKSSYDFDAMRGSRVWVPIIRSWALTRGYALHPGTSCVASFTGSGGLLAVRRGRSKDLEIIVLRHQLGVLHRRNNRPQLADEDRALLGAVAAALPRRRRAGWLVTSETLLRWHRRRTARPRTQPSGTPGRPSTSGSLRRLILETANDNPVGARNGSWLIRRC